MATFRDHLAVIAEALCAIAADMNAAARASTLASSPAAPPSVAMRACARRHLRPPRHAPLADADAGGGGRGQ